MKENSFLWILIKYIKDQIKTIIIYISFILIFIIVFSLYSLELEAVLYAFLLSTCFATILFIYDFIKYYKNHITLCHIKKEITTNLDNMPLTNNLIEIDYQNIISVLYKHKTQITSKLDNKHTDMMDYFTLWAHQIKTPISVMRLLLQEEQNEQNKEMLTQLFKIEQYSEMVLGYLKVESSSSDLVIQNYNLCDIIKQAVRKYAYIFIKKGITLDFKEINFTILTDEKWLVFVIEQILSNALKYTNKGKISIYMDETKQKTLIIEDTGIGIAEEDLPRIFEKGFTGYNGRMDKKATGIGLYLCKKY
jgi:signal transduction histidine kinase